MNPHGDYMHHPFPLARTSVGVLFEMIIRLIL